MSWKTSLSMRTYSGDRRLVVIGYSWGIETRSFIIAVRSKEGSITTFLPYVLIMGIDVRNRTFCSLKRWNFLKGCMVKPLIIL